MRDTREFRKHIYDKRLERWWAASGLEKGSHLEAYKLWSIARENPAHPMHRLTELANRAWTHWLYWSPSPPRPELLLSVEITI